MLFLLLHAGMDNQPRFSITGRNCQSNIVSPEKVRVISGSSIFFSLVEAVLLDLFWKSGLSFAFEVKEWLINTTIGVMQKAINKIVLVKFS